MHRKVDTLGSQLPTIKKTVPNADASHFCTAARVLFKFKIEIAFTMLVDSYFPRAWRSFGLRLGFISVLNHSSGFCFGRYDLRAWFKIFCKAWESFGFRLGCGVRFVIRVQSWIWCLRSLCFTTTTSNSR